MDSSPFRAGGPNHPYVHTDEGAFSVVDLNLWRRWRERAYRQFLEDIEIGYVDYDLVPLIRIVFERQPNLFTISSCSGRIVIVDTDYPWLRDEAYIVFKKHSPVKIDEVQRILAQPCLSRLWLIASGPIIHFVANSLEAALHLLKRVRSIGFKHSGIISVSRDGIVVEVVSGVWTSFLLKEQNTVVLHDQGLQYTINVANKILVEAKKRLAKLYKLLFYEVM